MKIIIVDDEITAHHTFLGDVIGKTDAEYRFFKDDEQEILDYIQKNKVSAAFLDISMPHISGFDLAKKIVRANEETRIVFVTGQSVKPSDLDADVRARTVGFLYKPYDADELHAILSVLEKGAPKLQVHMFGSFEVFMGDSPVRFSSNKSKELFALLVAYNGRSLSMTDAISQLWPDLDVDKSKILYRDAVWRLRKTLQQIDFNCVDFARACLFLNKEGIQCDYWDFLQGIPTEHSGEFCKSYDWGIEYLPSFNKE